jgi:hypothetical protein
VSKVTYRQGHIIQSNVEPGSAAGKVVSHQTGNHLTLCNKLTGIELSNNALQHLVDNRGQDSLVEVLTKCAVDLRQSIYTGSRQDTAGDVDHLQVLGTGKRRDVARFGADIVDDGGFEPRNLEMSS